MTSWGCCSLCSKPQNISHLQFILCVFDMLTHKIGISVEKYMINVQFINDIISSGAISNFPICSEFALTRHILFWIYFSFFVLSLHAAQLSPGSRQTLLNKISLLMLGLRLDWPKAAKGMYCSGAWHMRRPVITRKKRLCWLYRRKC